jgi:hypothetical protein
MQHIGSTLTIILGVLALVTGPYIIGTGGDPLSYIDSGVQMILGGIAYQLAKKRKSGELPNTSRLKIFEGILIISVASISFFRHDMAFAIRTEPFPTVIIPAWIFVAYLIVAFKKGTD